MIAAANEITHTGYRFGGGHGSFDDSAYDCSGAVSHALHGANLVKSPLDSTDFESWGARGKGQWITVYAEFRPRLRGGGGPALRHLRKRREGPALAQRGAFQQRLRGAAPKRPVEAGGEGLEPPLPGPKPGVLPARRPPRAELSIGPSAASSAASLRALMAKQPTVLIMAAGQGTRMRSSLAKVLHPVCGRPMLHWAIEAAREADAGRIVCVTRPGEGVAEELPDGVENAEQRSGEGTGAAVLAARDHIDPDSTVVVLSGDHPLIAADLIEGLAEQHARDGVVATLVSTDKLDPAGYGRIIRAGDGSVERIVETKTTDGVPADVLAIREINVGTYAFTAGELFDALDAVPEVDGERYLTGVFAGAAGAPAQGGRLRHRRRAERHGREHAR